MDCFNINNSLKLNLNNGSGDGDGNGSDNKFEIKLVSKYRKRLDYEFNVLIVGEIFKSTNKHLLVGTADGKIRVYLNNEEIEVLETKGSSIQDIELLDTSKFGSIDVISGDSNGNLVIFSNHQILYRDTINGSITKITNHQLANCDFNLVVGDNLGFVTAIKPHQNALWRFKIPTINQTLNSLTDSDILKINPHITIESIFNNDNQNSSIDNSNSNNSNNIDNSSNNNNNNRIYQQPSLHIRQIKSVQGYDVYNNKFHYILISENAPFLHIIDHGKRLCSIPTPSPVICMCVGFFTNSIASKSSNSSGRNSGSINNSNQSFTETPRSNHNHHHSHSSNNSNNNNSSSDDSDDGGDSGNNNSGSGNSNNKNKKPTQVALGCENGYIYLLTQDFRIEPYCQVGYPVTLLNKIKYSEIEDRSIKISDDNSNNSNSNNNNSNNDNDSINNINNDMDDIDILICTGYFHSIKLYYNKDLVCDHSLDDWVYTLSIGAVENNGDKTIVVGTLDNSIEYLKPIIINNNNNNNNK